MKALQPTLFHGGFKRKTPLTSEEDRSGAEAARKEQEALDATAISKKAAEKNAASMSGVSKLPSRKPSQSAAAVKKRNQRARKPKKTKREKSAAALKSPEQMPRRILRPKLIILIQRVGSERERSYSRSLIQPDTRARLATASSSHRRSKSSSRCTTGWSRVASAMSATPQSPESCVSSMRASLEMVPSVCHQEGSIGKLSAR